MILLRVLLTTTAVSGSRNDIRNKNEVKIEVTTLTSAHFHAYRVLI